jgi:hypothetical protein
MSGLGLPPVSDLRKWKESYFSPTTTELAHTSGGLWASAAHIYTDCEQPRRFYHIKAHPEHDPARKENPTIIDKAIYVADAVSGYLLAQDGPLRNDILPARLG